MTLEQLLISGWYHLLYRKFDREEILFLYRRGDGLKGFDLTEWPEFILCKLNVNTLQTTSRNIKFDDGEES